MKRLFYHGTESVEFADFRPEQYFTPRFELARRYALNLVGWRRVVGGSSRVISVEIEIGDYPEFLGIGQGAEKTHRGAVELGRSSGSAAVWLPDTAAPIGVAEGKTELLVLDTSIISVVGREFVYFTKWEEEFNERWSGVDENDFTF